MDSPFLDKAKRVLRTVESFCINNGEPVDMHDVHAALVDAGCEDLTLDEVFASVVLLRSCGLKDAWDVNVSVDV